MSKLLNIVTDLHKKTKRDYLARMMDDKVACSKIAREYGQGYWDGDRRYGYGGYKYDGRWEIVAKKLIDTYKLKDDSRILDVGCGKGFLLYEFKRGWKRFRWGDPVLLRLGCGSTRPGWCQAVGSSVGGGSPVGASRANHGAGAGPPHFR